LNSSAIKNRTGYHVIYETSGVYCEVFVELSVRSFVPKRSLGAMV